MLARLAAGEATVNELAAPHAMSLPSISRHLKVLERAGLVHKAREAQWRPCRLETAPPVEADAWIGRYREFFEYRIGRLEAQLADELARDGQKRDQMTIDTAPGFTLRWTLAADRAQVFRAWTDPDHLTWFYNPDQPAPTEPIELDLRVGGVWRQRMVECPGEGYYTGGIDREIVINERLAFAWGAVGGWPQLDPERLDDSPLVTVTLADTDLRGTEMVIDVRLPARLSRDEVEKWLSRGIRDGWQHTIDRLAAYVD